MGVKFIALRMNKNNPITVIRGKRGEVIARHDRSWEHEFTLWEIRTQAKINRFFRWIWWRIVKRIKQVVKWLS